MAGLEEILDFVLKFTCNEPKPVYVAQFWQLFSIRWQSLSGKLAGKMALGSGAEGTIWQVYARSVLTDTPVRLCRLLKQKAPRILSMPREVKA